MNTHGVVRDLLNPKFVYQSPIDERTQIATHVERAIAAWYFADARTWAPRTDDFHVVRETRVEPMSPVAGPGNLRVDLWVEHLGTTTCVYGFLVSSEDGRLAHARGERTIVKIDPLSERPAPWSAFFRDRHAALLKDLPAFA